MQNQNNIIWEILSVKNELLSGKICKEIKCSSTFANFLINRGFSSLEEIIKFLHSDLSDLYDPFLMKDMDKAVIRIKKAISAKQKVLIFGDFDADGITSISLLYLGLSKTGLDISYYVPSRLEEGYGLNEDAISFAKKNEINLIITVDCGITSAKEVSFAKSLGIDIIITDHHEPKGEIPPADAIINPKQEDCSYPFKELAGVGVAYKLLTALKLSDGLLELVVLGTIADVVPLVSENRIIVKHGLQELLKSSNTGIKNLIIASGLQNKILSSYDVGFMLTPRINAVGRLGDANKSVRLLITGDEQEAKEIANFLNDENKSRQKIEKDILVLAEKKIQENFNFENDRVIVVNDDSWHQGVVGIVASRIVEKYYRPAVVIASNGEQSKGSCRSIKGFNVFDALCKASSHLIKFGGHEFAAGLSIKTKKIDSFRKTINKIALEEILIDYLKPKIKIDAQIDLSEITFKLAHEFDMISPFGAKNPKPVLLSSGLKITNPPRIVGEAHVQFQVEQNKTKLSCIAFKMKDRYDEIMKAFIEQKPVDVVYNININEWNGRESLQLVVKDFAITEGRKTKHEGR
ncbi:single-stranded-DNA-specific exonuclease RecJ [bacterium]|nr:single-stranded-DNA-specific exonuclease RecJ [bacterium]